MKPAYRYLVMALLILVAVLVQGAEYYKARSYAVRENATQLDAAIAAKREWNSHNKAKIATRAKVVAILSRFEGSLHHEPALLADLIMVKSEEYRIDPFLILGVIKTESDFDRYAVSSKGAVGLMQVRPHTASYLADTDREWHLALTDNETNINMGTLYLSQLMRRFGSLELALEAYNRGPTELRRNLDKDNGLAKDRYSKKVINNYLTMKRGTATL